MRSPGLQAQAKLGLRESKAFAVDGRTLRQDEGSRLRRAADVVLKHLVAKEAVHTASLVRAKACGGRSSTAGQSWQASLL